MSTTHNNTDHERILLLESHENAYNKNLSDIFSYLERIEVTLKQHIISQSNLCKNQLNSCLTAQTVQVEKNGEKLAKRPTWQNLLIILSIYTVALSGIFKILFMIDFS